jgi:FkbM family methyltransferase
MLPARLASKPQYVLHPARAVRRAWRLVSSPPAEGPPSVARLPWGLDLHVREADAIGYSILVGRVFDPCVTEALHRLIDPGETVLDAGANVGYMTSLAAVRAGPSGRVLSFEPHPDVFALLERNVASWSGRSDVATVEPRRVALSDRAGRGRLLAGEAFAANMGLATLTNGSHDDEAHSYEVELQRLDELLDGVAVGVLKIDVEGHEAGVLRGASGLLERRLVRDIVFEDHDTYPSEATELVESAGYHLVCLDNDLRGLVLRTPQERGEVSAWPGPSYLATTEPARSLVRLAARGWRTAGIGVSLPGRRTS